MPNTLDVQEGSVRQMKSVPAPATSRLPRVANSVPLAPKKPPLTAAIDAPATGELVYQHGFDCQGWVHHDNTPIRVMEVSVDDDVVVGGTRIFYDRPDVAEAFGRPDMLAVGFTLRCSIPEELRTRDRIELRFDVIGEDEATRLTVGRRIVRLSKVDYRQHGHGTILTDGALNFLKRDQVYGSGPPSPHADGVCVELVKRYIAPQSSVLDVGCGIGAWCGPLTSHGVQWTGCETRQDFVQHMLAAGLQAVAVEDGRLPFDDRAFDQTISIEVLEHVADHESFLSEVSRVSRTGGLFSVPNFAAIPVTASVYALPWHMLESDHKNFFTARSLQALLQRFYETVETFEYGPLPQFRSTERILIKNHVFAIARH